jgi:hypothetical protein
MKYFFPLFIITFFAFCCKKETQPHILSGIEIPMVGKWKEFGDTTFILKLDGSTDTILHKMHIELKEDLSFICRYDDWFMNKFDTVSTGNWFSDTITYNVIFLRVTQQSGDKISFPNNEIRWGVWPSPDTLLIAQEYNSQSGITFLSYRKFRKY